MASFKVTVIASSQERFNIECRLLYYFLLLFYYTPSYQMCWSYSITPPPIKCVDAILLHPILSNVLLLFYYTPSYQMCWRYSITPPPIKWVDAILIHPLLSNVLTFIAKTRYISVSYYRLKYNLLDSNL